MLFFPGAISQLFATILFFIVVIGGGYSVVRIYYQNQKITYLENKLVEYQLAVSITDKKEELLKKNIDIIQRNCNRKAKPVIQEGKLNVENLFGKPR